MDLRARSALWLGAALASLAAAADEPQVVEKAAAAAQGWELLTGKAYLPADFDQEVFDQLWTVWPPELRERARGATPAERRRMAFSRYGLIEHPERNGRGPALGYVDDGRQGWVMNCLTCHGGKVAGQVIPGLPNSHLALETLIEEVRAVKLRMGKPLAHMDLGSLRMPLGTSIGTTNSVMFGVALEALRDRDMRFTLPPRPPRLLHHDLDAPPWWNVRKKSRLYYQGLVRKQPRPLMQFVLVPENGPETLRAWEPDFAKILAWIETLEPPRYPGPIDEPLAARGRAVFERHCTKCHGTYGTEEEYPELVVPLEVVGTDPVRQQALPDEYHRKFQESWLAEYEGYKPPAVRGYVAPPLDGIWASAPYLHNGSVPTLWHLLHPQQRPRAWKRTEDGYDRQRVGLEIQVSESVPEGLTPAERRTWFDTARRGKSASGHDFPEKVPLEERPSLLEYLKTL